MPKVNVYLPDRYAEVAKKYDLALSALTQDAVLGALARQLPLLSLTPRARDLLQEAEQQARHFGHNSIGVEHLLLAIIAEGKSVASTVLQRLDVEERIQEELERVMRTEEYTSHSHKAVDRDGNFIGYLVIDPDNGAIRVVDEHGNPVAISKSKPSMDNKGEGK